MLIGEVARRSGVSTRMLRHYDRLGLVRPTERTAGGYREYSDEDMRRIFHVESLRSLGLSLADVQRMLDDPGFTPSALVADLIEQTRRRIAQEQELLGRLQSVEATGPADLNEVLRVITLLHALESPQAGLRQRTALTAANAGPLPAAALAEAYLVESDPNVAGAIGWALTRAGGEGLENFVAGLASTQPEVRRRAVAAVAAVDDERTTELLRAALDDPDPDVRDRVALALGGRGETDAVPVLIEMVVEGRLDVEAAETLGLLTTTTGTADDVVTVLVCAARDGDRDVRRRLAQALAEIPGATARAALSALARDDDPAVSFTARFVLSDRR